MVLMALADRAVPATVTVISDLLTLRIPVIRTETEPPAVESEAGMTELTVAAPVGSALKVKSAVAVPAFEITVIVVFPLVETEGATNCTFTEEPNVFTDCTVALVLPKLADEISDFDVMLMY